MGCRRFVLAGALGLCSIVSLVSPAVACEGDDFSTIGMYYDLLKSNYNTLTDIANNGCPGIPSWVAYQGCLRTWAKPYCRDMEEECKDACEDSCGRGSGGSSSSSSGYPDPNDSNTPSPDEPTLDDCEARCEVEWDSRHKGGLFSDPPAPGSCGLQAKRACEMVRDVIKACDDSYFTPSSSPSPSPSP